MSRLRLHISRSRKGELDYYARVAGTLVEPAPAGLIASIAGPTDEGVRIIEVRDTEEAWDRFRTERLAPTIAALQTPERSEPTFRSLHVRQTHFRPGGELRGSTLD